MKEQASDTVVDEAAQWMVRLQNGPLNEQDRQAFLDWQAAHPRHALVYQRMSESLGILQQPALTRLTEEQLIQTLNTPSSRRRFLRGSLGAVGMIGLLAVGVRLADNRIGLSADLSTGIGERNEFELADGSRLTLNAQSRVSSKLTSQTRELYLRRGSLLLQSAAGERPLGLNSRSGRLDIQQPGRFLLESRANGLEYLSVLESSAYLRTADGRHTQIAAGQQAQYSPSGLLSVEPVEAADSAWLNGLIEAQDRPLGEVIDALRPYRRGVLRISPAAARLHTSGIYPLDDSDRALRLLAQTLPIQVTRYSEYWVTIDTAT